LFVGIPLAGVFILATLFAQPGPVNHADASRLGNDARCGQWKNASRSTQIRFLSEHAADRATVREYLSSFCAARGDGGQIAIEVDLVRRLDATALNDLSSVLR
jgi:hypothetical protein